MTYVEPKPAVSTPRFRMRDLTLSQCLAFIGGACVIVGGIYFLFSIL
jgi:hypothetical protein